MVGITSGHSRQQKWANRTKCSSTYISVHCYQHLAKTIKRVTDTQFLLQKNNNTNNHNVIHETHKYIPVYIKFIFSNLINDSLVRQLLYITVLKRT